MNEHEKPQIDFMHKLARQIVERRNLVFLFVVLATIFTIFAVKWVKVETDMTTYLPKTSETRLGLDIMEDQSTTYGSADVMVANITPDEADALSDQLTELKGVQMLDYDDTGSIGKRYRREDEIGTPYCITFDFDTVGDEANGIAADHCVTIRERDSMEQVRIPIDQVKDFLREKCAF